MADKIDILLEHVREARKETKQHWANHMSAHERIDRVLIFQNGRLRKLELWRAYLIGIAIGASGLTTGAILKLFG